MSGTEQGDCTLSVAKYEDEVIDIQFGEYQIHRERILQTEQDLPSASQPVYGTARISFSTYSCMDRLTDHNYRCYC